MRISLEMYLMQNLLMNTLVLVLGARMAQKRIRLWRVALAAALGCGYAVLCCLKGFAVLQGVCFRLLCIGCMTLLAFYGRDLKTLLWLRLTGFCFVALALLGGTGMGLMQLAGTRGFGIGTTILLLVLGIAAALWFCVPLRQRASGRERHTVALTVGKKTLCFTGMVDTGNELIEPVSGLPVMLVSPELLGGIPADSTLPVPFSAMGQKGLVRALYPKRLVVDGTAREWFVAAYPAKLPCGALLPPFVERAATLADLKQQIQQEEVM